MMEEVWKDIEGYEGIYEVSSLGRVRSLDRMVLRKDGRQHFVAGVMMQGQKHPSGYRSVGLWANGHCDTMLIHRIVAEAFIPNPDQLPDINHKNEDKTDNRANNLEWCTKKYNNNYGQHHEKHLAAISQQMHSVEQIDTQGNIVHVYPSVSEAARAVGCTTKAIRQCVKGICATVKGYRWKYTESEHKTE